ncbi:MAG: site-specific DNA-methyltransferase, partial [Fusobacteriaceae bacterium]
MIYIDPPYNTGKDFVYPDNFKDNLKNYLEITGQVGEDGQKLSTNSDSSGRYHSDWLNMMYPRLKLAKNLLTDDGVIFISIDDNEVTNLKKLCDEIFGEENFVAQIAYQGMDTIKNDAKYFSENFEFLFCYSKNKINLNIKGRKRTEEHNKVYKNFDNDERGDYLLTPLHAKSGSESGIYEYKFNNGIIWSPPKGTYPRFSKETLHTLEKDNRIYFGKNFNSIPQRKTFLKEVSNYIKLTTFWDYKFAGSTRQSNKELSEVLSKGLFQNPKPTKLLKILIDSISYEFDNDIILDFFSGSGTTAHATMQLNAEDGGNRKYIMVQLPEPTPDNSEASKAGYKNICEIGKERIRRAGEKVKSDETLPLENREKLDVGFKVFKLDTSNIKEWDSETEDLKQSLFDSIDNIKTDRTSLDVLYEILLKYGLDLNVPIVENKEFYSIGGGTLLINLDTRISLDVIDSMCEEYKALLKIDEDYKTTVVLRDSSFQNDIDKTNAIQKLKQVGIKEIRSI